MCEEQTVSLVDVLEEDEELEEEASAVLAGSDSDHCSYPLVGFLLQASDRNFRCDCGNRKFSDLQCKLQPEKDDINSLNKYSHNFFGVYCTCRRPYPDPDDPVEDEMIQCVVCEDWLHSRHLGCVVPDCVELQEMICEACMKRSPVLWVYAAHLAAAGPEEPKEEGPGAEEITAKSENHEKDVTEPSCKRSHEEAEPSCRLKELQAGGQKRVQSGAVFWPSGWRSKLCSCASCQLMLSEAGLSFLLDEADTVLEYENKGKTREREQPGTDPLMSALDNLSRVQQLEIIHGYNDMKTDLKDFLQRFAAEGKVVTSEDIRQFFEQQSSKRRRMDAGTFSCS
ncbi:putative E3 ubiquitin-protein ligase UBR7 isoform X5 [Oryzias latipes]|nr:putative E3 ubiquitin-protein ligase UBR7 isoform X5 [Oryzias latipes]